MPRFPSEEWVAEFHEAVNSSEAYEKAAATWEGDFNFVIEPEGDMTKEETIYIDLWHGKSRAAYLLTGESEEEPEFVIWAPVSSWKRVILKQVDPIQALLTRQLRLRGNMVKIMKAVKAAQELVNCCTMVESEFPV
jgi:putative sterol carrier protein